MPSLSAVIAGLTQPLGHPKGAELKACHPAPGSPDDLVLGLAPMPGGTIAAEDRLA
jgi:hypothetical protein